MLLHICLSIYNGADFIKEQLKSLEQQSFDLSHIFLLVRDDGSTDKSYEILQNFIQNSSLHVSVLEDRINLGAKKSFELLMHRALELNAQYIMFADQDDIWHKNKIEKTFLKIKELESQYPSLPLLIHSNVSVVDRELNAIASSFWKYQHIDPSKDSLNHLVFHNVVTGCTMLINCALAKKVKNIPNEAIMHDWWLAMVASVFGKIAYIDEPLMLYRQHGGNDTGAKKYGLKYIWNKFLAQGSLDKYIEQAKCFLVLYENELDKSTKQMLEEFAQFNSLSKFRKIVLLFRYNLWINGFVRNVGLVVMA